MLVHILERRIPVSAIQSYSLSPYNDNFIIVHAPEDFDVALMLDFKTELVATINRAKGSNCNISFKPKYAYPPSPLSPLPSPPYYTSPSSFLSSLCLMRLRQNRVPKEEGKDEFNRVREGRGHARQAQL